MDTQSRIDLVRRNEAETLTPEDLAALLARESRPKAYIGFEPSGLFTVGHLVTVAKVKDLAAAGFDVTVFLADWHAMINDKLGGSLERIQASGHVMEQTFRSLGAQENVRFRWAHELVGSADYWARVIRCAKAMSLARVKRAMTIMGRKDEEADVDAAKMFYPAMQVADIFELPVDLAYAGLDQRRAHVLAREVAHHYHWRPPVAVHTPLISSLKGGGRMNMDEAGVIERKMSKSDPTAGIPIPSTPALIEERIKGAYCPAKELEGNPLVELVNHVILPWEGKLEVKRPAKFGGDVSFTARAEFEATWREGKLHPQDLKATVVAALTRILAPANDHFAAHPEALAAFAPK